MAMAAMISTASMPTANRIRARSAVIPCPPYLVLAVVPGLCPRPGMTAALASRRDGLAIGGPPAPGARAVAALDHPLLVDLGDDLAVAGKQRLGRAHLGAERQLALGEPVGAILHELGLAVVRLRAAGAIGALVHLAARPEVTHPRILRRAERARIEAIAAADAEVLGV